jgi:hypothetical protein
MKEKLIFIILILFASNAYAVKACKDENGRTYFTDVSCPEGTTSQNEVNVEEANTYRARDSIDVNILNDYERRYKTGRSWRWIKKQRSNNN